MPKAFLVKKTGRVGSAGGRPFPVEFNRRPENVLSGEDDVRGLMLINKKYNNIAETRVPDICEIRDVASQVAEDDAALPPTDRWRINSTGNDATGDGRSSLLREGGERGKILREGGERGKRDITLDPLESGSKTTTTIKRFLIGPDPPRISAQFPLSVIQPIRVLPSAPADRTSCSCPAFLLGGLCRSGLQTSSIASPIPSPFYTHPQRCPPPPPPPPSPSANDDGQTMKYRYSPTTSPDVPFPTTSGLPLGISGPFFSAAPSSIGPIFRDASAAVQIYHFPRLSTNFTSSHHHHLRHSSEDFFSPEKKTSNAPDQSTDRPPPEVESEAAAEVTYRSRPEAPPRFQCEACQKSYSTFNGLSKHKEFHCTTFVKKTFACPHCDSKSYTSLGALKMHIRTHTLPCRCRLCGKAFSRPWLLQGHLRTHTGEKPFECQHCCRAFADRSNLRAHLQTHADVKKYNCRSCAKTFSRMSLLLKHKENSCYGVTR